MGIEFDLISLKQDIPMLILAVEIVMAYYGISE